MAPVMAQGDGGAGSTAAGPGGGEGLPGGVDLAGELERLRLDVQTLASVVEELRGKYNAHTHVENTAPAYTQNATTAAPAAGQQVSTPVITR